MSGQSKGRAAPSSTAAAAERVRRLSVRDDAQIAAFTRGARSARDVAQMKAFVGVPPDASAAELQAASRAYLEHGPADTAARASWERLWQTMADKPAFAAGLPAGLPAAGTPAAEIMARAKAAVSPAAASSEPSAPVSTPVSAGEVAEVGADGRLSWQGAPVSLNSAGEPCVLTTEGWMSTSAAAAAGITEASLVEAQELARFAPGGPTARALREGPR